MATAGLSPKISTLKTPLETVMSKAKLNAMQARLDVLSLALAALAREVPAERAMAVQDRLDGAALSSQVDAAVATDLSRLMGALGCRLFGNPLGPN
jgi:hypothetical protein